MVLLFKTSLDLEFSPSLSHNPNPALTPVSGTLSSLFDPVSLWAQIYEQLALKLKKHSLQTWFKTVSIKEIKDDFVVLRVPNEFSRNFISQTYLPIIESVIREVTASNLGLRLIVENLELAELVVESPNQLSLASFSAPKNKKTKLRSNYNFDNFISNKANRLALLFIKAFMDPRASRYGSLLLHSPTGLGKTHLLQAMAHQLSQNSSQVKLLYVSAESFANELFEAIRNKRTGDFHNKYRKLDFLFFDDAQFLENKKSTQEEFYYTFEAITQAGGKVVIASSKNPSELENIDAKLKNRLLASLVTEIFEHDFGARMDILKAKTISSGLDLSEAHLELIASKPYSSVRELESALDKLSIYSEFGDIDDGSMVELFGFSHCSSGVYKGLDILRITETVARYFGLEIVALQGTSRSQQLSKARHIAIYLSRELLKISYKRIGECFSNRKHSSIIHSIQLIRQEISRDRSLALVIDDIKSKLCG